MILRPRLFAHAHNCTLVAMDHKGREGFKTISAACEYKQLKECLDRNQGKKEKCEKEWEEFQNICARNKKYALYLLDML